MKFYIRLWGTIFIVVILALVVFMPPKCEHPEKGKIYSFVEQGSTASNRVKAYCDDCDHYLGGSMPFQGNPCLDVIREHSDSDEIIGGEYYTITAVVTRPIHEYEETMRCLVQSGNVRVNFPVDFQEGLEDMVALVQAGDEITFRGRFYDSGCGFTDAELINN